MIYHMVTILWCTPQYQHCCPVPEPFLILLTLECSPSCPRPPKKGWDISQITYIFHISWDIWSIQCIQSFNYLTILVRICLKLERMTLFVWCEPSRPEQLFWSDVLLRGNVSRSRMTSLLSAWGRSSVRSSGAKGDVAPSFLLTLVWSKTYRVSQ